MITTGDDFGPIDINSTWPSPTDQKGGQKNIKLAVFKCMKGIKMFDNER